MKEKLNDILNYGCIAVFTIGIFVMLIWSIVSNIKAVLYFGLVVLAIGAILWLIDQCYYAYKWWRRKRNKPLIGDVDFPLTKLLKKDDYVSIGGRVLRFTHFAQRNEPVDVLRPPLNENQTIGGELAFDNPNGLGYIYYRPGALKKCDFIYGKYGTKWAATKELADSAKQRINESDT